MYLLCSWIEVVEVSCTHMNEAHPHLTSTPGDPVYSISHSQSTIYTHNAYTYKRGKHSHTWNKYKSFRKQMVGESQGRSLSRTRSRSKSLERFGLFIICHHFGEIWSQRYRWNNLLYKYMVKKMSVHLVDIYDPFFMFLLIDYQLLVILWTSDIKFS